MRNPTDLPLMSAILNAAISLVSFDDLDAADTLEWSTEIDESPAPFTDGDLDWFRRPLGAL